MKKFKLIDYKSKHFIIQDKIMKSPEWGLIDIEIGEITKTSAMQDTFVKPHKERCNYYGIPCYIGKDKELNKIYNEE